MPIISGVIAASITPLNADLSIDLNGLSIYLDFLAERGCHGALLLGTTGEGPSISIEQRKLIFAAAARYRADHPDFVLLAGTGMPALNDTITLTKLAFEFDLDGVVVLPPYYFKNVSVEGLYTWYAALIRAAVPHGKALLGYHIPQITGVPLPIELLERLKNSFPERFMGIKDSSGNADHAQELGRVFGNELRVFTGNDKLFQHALDNHAAGCITALANIGSPLSRQVWDAIQQGEDPAAAQTRLSTLRARLDQNPPAPVSLKALLHAQFGQPNWVVVPPLVDYSPEQTAVLKAQFAEFPEIF